MVLALHYGNAVAGDQRFDRPKLQEKLLRTLASSGGVKMFGLRRIGKSTLRRYVIEQMEQARKPVAFFDAQGLQSIQELLGDLFGALPRESDLKTRALGFIAKDSPIRNALEALASGTKTGEALVSAYWREAYNGIRKALSASPAPPLLVIDEFSLFLKNMLERNPEGRGEIDQLLAAMREWRAAGMKMLLTGSIGVTALSRHYKLTADHLNDLQPFEVPELSDDEAREFIREATEKPSQGRWTDEHTGKFIEECGVLYPSFVVKGLLEIGVQSPPPPGDFAGIFAHYVRPVLHDDFYNQFNKRFKFYGEIDKDGQRKLVVPVLKRIMEAADGTPLDDLELPDGYSRIDLAEFLDMLVEDGFIHFSEDADANRIWVPASRLAKLWWKRSRLT
ncbi:ATP-binding protein [Accumulibacter sp.]|uniref:ATP-binding protein n=1 Tax=Accumulibacter sp. TaxID=2053492 RepID=UPI00261D3E26|nr:ATP-binding protein [Accumulibacter sp.]